MPEKRMQLSEAKAQFSAIVDDVAHGAEAYIIERRGRPVAAVVSVEELERLRAGYAPTDGPRGLLGFVGAWGDIMTNEEVDEFVKDVYEARARDMGRPVNLDE